MRGAHTLAHKLTDCTVWPPHRADRPSRQVERLLSVQVNHSVPLPRAEGAPGPAGSSGPRGDAAPAGEARGPGCRMSPGKAHVN